MNSRVVLFGIGGLFLVLIGFMIWKNIFTNSASTYNWDIELTHPKGFDVAINNISYFRDGKEFKRLTSKGNIGWSGSKYGSVLHSKVSDYLPDIVKVSWQEKISDKSYELEFNFPKEKVLEYWNRNKALLKDKWGSDYEDDELSLRLGMAPGGFVVLWLSGYDINTSNYAVELETYKAKEIGAHMNDLNTDGTFVLRQNLRFGTPHFYPKFNENVVSLYVTYYNGEAETINLKNTNGSVLKEVNTSKGWSFAKSITTIWFDTEGIGYRSTYEMDWDKLPPRKNWATLRNANFVYLLDRQDDDVSEWNALKNRHVIELMESSRELMSK